MKKILVCLLFLNSLIFADQPFDCKAEMRLKDLERIQKERYNPLTQTPYVFTQRVDVATGANIEQESDLVVAGIQPLSYHRFYNHMLPYDETMGNWRYNLECLAVANFESGCVARFAAVGERDGTIQSFETSDFSRTSSHLMGTYTFDLSKHKTCVGSEGATHPFNTTIQYRRQQGKEFSYQGEIKDGSGRVRYFTTPHFSWLDPKPVKIEIELEEIKRTVKGTIDVLPISWTPYQLLIHEEKLPNGNILCYTYIPWQKNEELYPQFRLVSTIKVYNAAKTKLLGSLEFQYFKGKIIGSDKREIQVRVGGAPQSITSLTSTSALPLTYHYQGSRLIQVDKPEGRILKTTYDGANRVQSQSAPVGPKGEFYPINRYVYHEGVTDVYDAENNCTRYHFDSEKRFYALQTPLHIDRYGWDPKTGNLLNKNIEDTARNIYFQQLFQYDQNHNPIQETLTDGKDSYTLYRTITTDGFNLKEKEWDDFGKEIHYTYVPGTNLLASELIYENTHIRKRTFHTYDDCAILIKTIEDDGTSQDPNDLSGVTTRKIQEITPRQTLPCFGFAEEIQEKTIDAQGHEVLLRKIRYDYHPSGKITKEEHYDAQNTHRYTLHHEYNDQELLISTTDPLGNKTLFTYDANHNLISQKGPRPDMHKVWVYDLANRPVQEKERQSDGSILSTYKKYDKASRLIATIDESGFETRYDYDPVGQLIAIHYPDGSTQTKEYDLLGNVIREGDPNGFETTKTYNFRQQLLQIHYPDVTESYTYNPNGTLLSHTDKNGATTTYTNDIFGNPSQTQTHSDGKLLKTTSATYCSFHKLSETDPEGNITTYSYDFAGRKIAEDQSGKKTTFAYDSLGRLSKTQIADTLYIQEYDLKGQLIQKSTLCAGAVLEEQHYAYDEAGNQTHIIYSQGLQETQYNTRNQPILKKDPLGYITHYTYTYAGGLVKIETDPKGIQTFHYYDCRQNEVKTIKKNDYEIQKVEKSYDPNKNLIQEKHFLDGKEILNTWTYGPGNRLEKCIESGQKETRYLYDEKGRLSCTIKPDGTQLHRHYDELGRLAAYFSKDFNYRYTYDKNDRVLTIDEGQAQTTRLYDSLGNITQEKLANGLILNYTFDNFGKRTKTLFPDKTDINYTYRANRLHSITRQGKTHTYLQRDLEGYLTQAELPFQLGTVSILRDPLSRSIQIHSPYYTSKLTYDPVGNLTHCQSKDPLGTQECPFTYDDLNQVVTENAHAYQFDSLYNRLKKDTNTYIVNELCQILHDGAKSYQYDSNGNLIFDGTTRFSYDSLDRLVSLQKDKTKIEYTYDNFNRRLSKTVFENKKQTQKQLYIYDGDLEIGSTNTQNKIEELRILGEGSGAEIGSAVFIEIKGKTYIPIHDHRGCLVTLIDPTKKIPAETYRYTAFGEELTPAKLSPWRFSSKRIDPETGWIYFGRRYYAPSLGRWVTPDPQGFEDGPNLYAYLLNCPLNDFYPYGLWSWKNTFDTFDAGLRTTFPMTYRYAQTNNYFMGIPSAIFEVGTWTLGATQRTALSLTQKSISQITYNALQRAETKAAYNAGKVVSIRAEERMLKKGIDANLFKGASKKADDYVNLVSPQRRTHILDGDISGGGHRFGTGKPGKSEFPKWWSDDKILHAISDVATNPSSITRAGRGRRIITEGIHDRIDIRVIQERNGDIVSGFPINLLRSQ